MDCKNLKLPDTQGPFGVGKVKYYLVDKSRKEKHSEDPKHPYRELMVEVWYPADRANTDNRLPYVSPEILEYTKGRGGRGLGYVDCSFMTNSFLHAPIAQEQSQYPVLIFSHGFSAPCYLYGSILEELASQGYVVVGINHTYAVDPVEFPDGRILGLGYEWFEILREISIDRLVKAGEEEVKTWIIDVEFVLNHIERFNKQDPQKILTGKLDLDAIGMFGHSFGGGTTVFINYLDKRCKAGVNMDGPVYGKIPDAPLKKPFMFLLSEEFTPDYRPTDEQLAESRISRAEFEKKNKFWKSSVQKAFDATTHNAYKILLKTANHMSFSDYNLLQCMDTACRLHSSQELELVRSFLVDFFSIYLKGHQSKVLAKLTSTNHLEITAKI